MRHLAIILALLAAACAPAGMNGASGTRAYGAQQAADAVLAALGRDNPSCRMWTNWQSLCSRTGPSMSTYCKQDPGFPVQPSEPFCVSQRVPLGTIYGGQFDTPEQRRSRNRFCDLFAGETGSVREQLGPMPICELYAAKRPFDGRRPEAIAHPLCRQWRQVTPETAAVLGPRTPASRGKSRCRAHWSGLSKLRSKEPAASTGSKSQPSRAACSPWTA